MIIKLKPISVKKIWGGKKLSTIYSIQQSNIGEVWGISAHKTNSNKIVNGKFKGLSFRDFYINHREYFGHYPKDEFPLLFKVIDAEKDLSVQVHPDDNYAFIHEKSYGKDECWYILEAGKSSRIQIGHKATNREELSNAIFNNSLETLLKYHQVTNDDLYYIPSGKVHAICKNTTLLEVSQSSDITYRLYDYNRLENGKPRTLHIQKSLDVISFPDTMKEPIQNNSYFSFDILEVNNEKFQANVYGDYLYVINGIGYVENEYISKGDFIIITSNSNYVIAGKLKIVLVRIKNNK